MSAKFTIEQIKDTFNRLGLTVLEEESKGVEQQYKCMDKEGYLYYRSMHTVETCLKRNIGGINHRFSVKNPFFYDNMLKYIELNTNNGTIILTQKQEIKSIKQPLKFRCGRCGKEYSTTWHTFMGKVNKVCNFCFNQMRSNGETNTKHNITADYHASAIKNDLAILDGPDLYYHQRVAVQDKEGYRGLVQIDSMLKGSKFERFSIKNPYTIDNLRIFAFRKGWDCVIYNQDYKGDKSPLKMLCSCGNDFTVTAAHFVSGKCRCNECRVKQSAIASEVELWLNQHKISYNKEKTFEGCVNKKPLPFDFYLDKLNACIEVDGLGHYRPVAFGGNKEEAEKTYQQRIANDKIKTDYCAKNNIPLLRLPFWIIEEYKHGVELNNFILSIERNELNK